MKWLFFVLKSLAITFYVLIIFTLKIKRVRINIQLLEWVRYEHLRLLDRDLKNLKDFKILELFDDHFFQV